LINGAGLKRPQRVNSDGRKAGSCCATVRRMSQQRDDDEERVIEIDAVLKHLEQVKNDTLKTIVSLRKDRDLNKARLSRTASKTR
jgi:hypothetical protein